MSAHESYLSFLYKAEQQQNDALKRVCADDQRFEDLLRLAYNGFERLRATRDSAALAACNARLREVANT